jgi:hypothetical protein
MGRAVITAGMLALAVLLIVVITLAGLLARIAGLIMKGA